MAERNDDLQLKVEICGINTSELTTLKNEQTMELLALSQQGNKTARDKLIAGNLRLVLSVVQRFSGRGEPMDDLFQVGCIGLIKGIDNFDLTTNFTAVAATFNNIGPGLGAVGPACNFAALNPLSKIVLIFDMLAGRLEIFPILILFKPRAWKRG